MCYFCIEYQKENLTLKEVSKLASELLSGEDKKHFDNFLEIGDNLSDEYKQKLDGEENEVYDEDFNDPFDPW